MFGVMFFVGRLCRFEMGFWVRLGLGLGLGSGGRGEKGRGMGREGEEDGWTVEWRSGEVAMRRIKEGR